MIALTYPQIATLGVLVALGISAVALLLARVQARSFASREVVRLFATFALVGLALSHPYYQPKPSSAAESHKLTVLADNSRSVMEEPLAERALLATVLPSNAQCVGFAAVAAPAECARVLGKRGGLEIGDTGRTNLATALQGIRGDVMLVSDGRENLGSAELSLLDNSQGPRLFPVILSPSASTNQTLAIDQIAAPVTVRAQARIPLSVAVRNVPANSQGVRVAVTRSTGEEPQARAVPSSPERESAQRIEFEFEPAENFRGYEEFTIRLLAEDGRELDRRVVLVSQNTEREILLVSQESAVAGPLRELATEQGFKVTVAESLKDFASAALQKFRAVVVVNTARAQLGTEAERILEEYARAGGTFVMTGGSRGYALGGYRGSQLERILPIEILPPETVQRRLSVAVGLVLDKSGSMSQGERLDGAKAAARSVVDNLRDEDTIAVIGFDDVPFVVLRAAPVGQVRQIAAERISRLFPAGRTNLIPALDEARRMLTKVDAGRKHVIVMTDGRLPDESDLYFEMLRQMRLVGITVSTVLLGGDNDYRFLKQMAEVGGGGFYQTNDPRMLPRIFLQDVKVSVNAPPPQAGELDVRPVTPSRLVMRDIPPVKSVSPARLREGAQLELGAFESGRSEPKPLLASRALGAGAVFAFLADAYGEQTESWFGWRRHGEFWRQVLSGDATQDAEAGAATPTVDLTIEQRGDYAALVFTLFNTPARASPEWRVTAPDGTEVTEKRIRQLAPGRFRILVRTATAGRYLVRIGEWLPEVGFKVEESAFADRVGLGVDETHLARLAQLSGGKVIRGEMLDEIKDQIRDLGVPLESTPERISLRWAALVALLAAQLLGMLWRERMVGR